MSRFLLNLQPATIQPGYCQCGCGQKTPIATQNETKRGYVKGEPHRYVYGHNRGVARCRAFYRVDKKTNCWTWLRATTPDGYGCIRLGGGSNRQSYKAHRLYYELTHGAIPEGHVVDHTCGNRSCVNPSHMRVVTHADNVRSGRNAKITMEDAREIRRLHATERWSYRRLAARFGVTAPSIYKVVKHLSWT